MPALKPTPVKAAQRPRPTEIEASSTQGPSKKGRSFNDFLRGILERNPPNENDADSDVVSCSEASTISDESDDRSEYTCGSRSENEKNFHATTNTTIAATLPPPTTKFLSSKDVGTVIEKYVTHVKSRYQEDQLSRDVPLDFRVWRKGSSRRKQESVRREYYIGRLRKLADTIQIGQHTSVAKALKQCHNLDETIKDLARSELKLGHSTRIRSRKNLRRKHQGIEHTGILQRAARMDWKEIQGSGDRDMVLAKALSGLSAARLRNLARVLAKNRWCPPRRGSSPISKDKHPPKQKHSQKQKHPPKQKHSRKSPPLPGLIKRTLTQMAAGDYEMKRLSGVKRKKVIFLLVTITSLFISWAGYVQIRPQGFSSKELKSAQEIAVCGRRHLNNFLEALNGILSEFGAIMVLRKRIRKIRGNSRAKTI